MALQRVIVGLGNPGKKYELTRHNIGAIVARAMADSLGIPFKEEKRFHSLVAKSLEKDKILHILLPTTYMNASGYAVKAYLDFYKLSVEHLIVLSDDVELPFKEVRFRDKGGSGGHNGLKSIESVLGTSAYRRLKFGVGKELAGATLADYVLDTFKPEEIVELPSFIKQGVETLRIRLGENHDNQSTEFI